MSLGHLARHANQAQLAIALRQIRALTLDIFQAYQSADCLQVPVQDQFNPPLWELGHVAWFQEWWLGRNSARLAGHTADPNAPRSQSIVPDADQLYNSSTVPHHTRWHLPLLNCEAVQQYLARTLAQSLALLESSFESDDALYFFRLCLLHEAMHVEAGLYMAQRLATQTQTQIPLHHIVQSMQPAPITASTPLSLSLPAAAIELGHQPACFYFDNEAPKQLVELAAFEIDALPVSWRQYLYFLHEQSQPLPAHVRPSNLAERSYELNQFGSWQPLDLNTAVTHLTLHQAQAYCNWAGRVLPTEVQWQHAAMTYPEQFVWGQVWEWTASPFMPYTGFSAHPYRDYSAPWFNRFDAPRQVLRGASALTHPFMRHEQYRNFFDPTRDDVMTGFRTCSI